MAWAIDLPLVISLKKKRNRRKKKRRFKKGCQVSGGTSKRFLRRTRHLYDPWRLVGVAAVIPGLHRRIPRKVAPEVPNLVVNRINTLMSYTTKWFELIKVNKKQERLDWLEIFIDNFRIRKPHQSTLFHSFRFSFPIFTWAGRRNLSFKCSFCSKNRSWL